jgi:hypothetical protein
VDYETRRKEVKNSRIYFENFVNLRIDENYYGFRLKPKDGNEAGIVRMLITGTVEEFRTIALMMNHEHILYEMSEKVNITSKEDLIDMFFVEIDGGKK